MRIHFFERYDFICAYFPDSLRYFRVNKKTKSILIDIQNDIPYDAICNRYEISFRELNKILDRLPKEKISPLSSFSADKCRRLVLHIANDCNLSCKYCYANGGIYLSKNTLMSPNILSHTLDRFFTHFEDIKSIQLFGGEPCFNLEAVETVGRFVEELDVSKRPDIYMITNGMLLTSEVIELLRRYQIHVTISMDGPENINDQLRIFKNGVGSTRVAENNLRRIHDRKDIPIMIEATYTKLHQESNISISDIVRYYFDNFGVKNIHVAPATGCDYSPDYVKAIKNDIKQIFANATTGYPMPSTIIQKIQMIKHKKNTTQLCDAGIGTYAVSTNGMVYPCFMVTDQTKLCMGNIADKDLFHSRPFLDIQNQLATFNKITKPKCKNCFANTMCTGCVGKNYFETGHMIVPSEEHCDSERTLLEEIILELLLSPRRVTST